MTMVLTGGKTPLSSNRYRDGMEKQILPATESPEKWWSMLVIGLGVFMGTLDMSSVIISLPTLVAELGTDFATIQWVIIGYVLVITSMMLGAARLGDMHVKKTLYNWGLVVFCLGSLLCGFAPSVGWLIAFRILQGIGSVLMQALGSAIIVEVFPPTERGRAMGMIGSIVSVGIASGPAIGGMIIGWVGWRWVFLLKVPIGLLTLFASILYLPSVQPVRSNQRFDIIGALVLLLTLISFALGMTTGQARGFGDDMVHALLAVSGAGLLGFVALEKRISQPMVDLSLFRNTRFSLNLLMGLVSFIASGGMFILPFFLEQVKGYPTFHVGLMMMASPVAMGLVAPLSGTISDRFGTRAISVAGLSVIVGGCYAISTLTETTSAVGYLMRVVFVGMGMGIFQSPNNSAIMGSVPPERLGVASGLMALARNLGTTIGIPLMGAVCTSLVVAASHLSEMTNIAEAPAFALVHGLNGTFRVSAMVLGISSVLFTMVLLIERRRGESLV